MESYSSFSKGGGRRPEDFEGRNPSPYSGEPNGLIALRVLPLGKGEFARQEVRKSYCIENYAHLGAELFILYYKNKFFYKKIIHLIP